ncbi:MAG: caspase family protein [Deltaproteobacteria bacterium]|nr:caspase family protein [Deltaproteobacteria bacterium]
MKTKFLLWLLQLLFLLTPVLGSAITNRPRYLAIIVGNDHGLNDELELRYAATDAEKVAKVLVDLAGFDTHDIHLLKNAQAKDLKRIFADINDSKQNDKQPAISLLFFYYSGHGDGANLHMQGSKLPFAQLRSMLAQTKAQVSITLMDSCKSGALTRAKGATLGPAYEIEFLKDPEVEGRIIITSSSEDEISQESDKIEGSFFTHNWISGLYGAADANADEIVTLEEAYRYAHYRTVEETITSRGGVQHPSYSFSLTGQGNVVLSRLARSSANIEIQSDKIAGQYYIVDAEKQLMLTEITQAASGITRVRLPPGRYLVKKRESQRLLVAEIQAQQNTTAKIFDTKMQEIPYVKDSNKGQGDIPTIFAHGPLFFMGLRNALTKGMDQTTELRAGYRVTLSNVFFEPRFIYRRANLVGSDGDYIHAEYDFGMAFGLRYKFSKLMVTGALDGGFVIYDQTKKEFASAAKASEDAGMAGSDNANAQTSPPPQGAIPLGLQGGLLLGVDYQLSATIVAGLYGYMGVAKFKQDDNTNTVFVKSGGLGIAYLF